MNVGVNKLDNVELLNVGANAFHDMKKFSFANASMSLYVFFILGNMDQTIPFICWLFMDLIYSF